MSELREILSETVTRLFTDLATKEALQAAEEGEWPEALWSALEENGLTQPLVPEAEGGVGAGWDDTFVIVRAAGYHAAPVPLAETILAGWLLVAAGHEVPMGPLSVVGEGVALELSRDGTAWRLRGAADRVPWGDRAGHVVVLARYGEALHVVLVPRDAYTVERDVNIAREPRDALTFDGEVAVVPAPSGLGERALAVYGAMFRAGQMAGALDRVLQEAVQYASDRVQFGRPIAKFQAIQQQLAVLAAEAAAADMAARTAFRAAERGDPAFEAACAKIVVGEAAGLGCSVAHQVHGAIGFTYEHVLHFLTRRLWSWRAEFGAESVWAEILGREAAGRGADRLWPDITARQASG